MENSYICEDDFKSHSVNISKDFTINGHNFSINACNKSAIFNVSSKMVNFKEIEFIDSQNAIVSKGDSSIIFENCKFVNSGVNFTGVNLTFKNCEFLENSHIKATGTSINIFNSQFHDLAILDEALSLNATNIVFKDNVFENNIAYRLSGDTLYTGGFASLINVSSANVEFSGDKFKNNTFEYLIYSLNAANIKFDDVTFENSDFSAYEMVNNIKKNIQGSGFIIAGNLTNLEINDSKFMNIEGSMNSYLFDINLTGNFSLKNTLFLNLSCPYGFIEIHDHRFNPIKGNIIFDRCTFKNIDTEYNMTCYDWNSEKEEYIWDYGHGSGNGIIIDFFPQYVANAPIGYVNKDLTLSNVYFENIEGGEYYFDFSLRDLNITNFTMTNSKIGYTYVYPDGGYYQFGSLIWGYCTGNVTLKDILQNNITALDYNHTSYNSTFDKYLCDAYHLGYGGTGCRIYSLGDINAYNITVTNSIGSECGVLVLTSEGNLTADKILVENVTGGKVVDLDKYYPDLDLQTFRYYGHIDAGLGILESDGNTKLTNMVVKNSSFAGPNIGYGQESEIFLVSGENTVVENLTIDGLTASEWRSFEIRGQNVTVTHVLMNNSAGAYVKNQSSYNETLGEYIWKYSHSPGSAIIDVTGDNWAKIEDINITNCEMGSDNLLEFHGGEISIDSVIIENITPGYGLNIEYDEVYGYLYTYYNSSGGYEGVLAGNAEKNLNISNIIISNAVATELGNVIYIGGRGVDSNISFVNVTICDIYPLNNNYTQFDKDLGRYISLKYEQELADGAFYIGTEGTINFKNVNVENIHGLPLIFNIDSDSFYMENSTFKNMSAYSYAIDFDKKTNQSIITEENNLGMLMSIHSDTIYLSNSTFQDMNFSNSAGYYDEYGMIFCYSDDNTFDNLKIINCTVNRAYEKRYDSETGKYSISFPHEENIGSIISVYGTNDNYIHDCEFINCTALKGGVFYLREDSDSELIVENTKFISNHAIEGGAIYIGNSQYGCTINNCFFINNTADNGGAIYVYKDGISISNCEFENNSAEFGGAIYWNGNDGHLEYMHFINNTATQGGAIYYKGVDNYLFMSEFRHNKAESGSAIYTTAPLEMDSATFLNNQAKSYAVIHSVNMTNDTVYATVSLMGGDNFINAIYTPDVCTGYCIIYWSSNGETNSDDIFPNLTNLEDGINITMELYDSSFKKIKSVNATTINNEAKLNISNVKNNRYLLAFKHYEDTYYTEISNLIMIQVGLMDTHIDLKADDIFYKENATVEVMLPHDATGNVTFEIDGVNCTTVNLTDAFASINKSGLAGGIHNVTVYYSGDQNYNKSSLTITFAVKQIPAAVNITTPGGYYKSNIPVNVTIPADAKGRVIVTVEDEFGHTLIINNTDELQTVINHLNAGEYNVTAYYSGDNNYCAQTNQTILIVKPIDLNPAVNASDVNTDENTTFTVTVPDDFNGYVNITVDKITKTYHIAGTTQLNFQNLTSGNKTARLTFYGDRNYNEATVYPVNFTVSEKATDLPTITVNIPDTAYPYSTTAQVNVSGNFNGTAVITVDERIFPLTVTNGTGSVVIDNLSAGIKTATVNFTSTDKQVNLTTVTKFEIVKAASKIDVKAEGRDVIVNVTAGATGDVAFYVNGEKQIIQLNNSQAVWKNILKIGNNTVVVVYEGCVNYTESENSTSLFIEKSQSAVNATAENIIYGREAVITVNVPIDQTGFVSIILNNKTYTQEIKDGKSVFNISGLTVGEYQLNVTYLGDDVYNSQLNTTGFNVTKADLPASVVSQNITTRQNSQFIITVPEDFSGKVNITVDGHVYSGSAKSLIVMDKLTSGAKTAKIIFWDDVNYNDLPLTSEFIVTNIPIPIDVASINADNMTRGYGSQYDYQAVFLDSYGNALVNTNVKFKVNGKTYTVKTNIDGIAQLTSSRLPVGVYNIVSVNPLTGEELTRVVKIIPRITENKNLIMDFADGSVFKVKVWGDDGNIANAGDFIDISVNKIHYVAKVNNNGYASLKINLVPKKYIITAEYKGFKTSNKLVIKQILKAVKKTTKISKGKKLVLKAKLKWSNGKAIKGKLIKFKLKGKTYKAKTNKKGIAKVTIKKKVTKKLKKGKKYTVKLTYTVKLKGPNGYQTVNDNVKCYVKVKK